MIYIAFCAVYTTSVEFFFSGYSYFTRDNIYLCMPNWWTSSFHFTIVITILYCSLLLTWISTLNRFQTQHTKLWVSNSISHSHLCQCWHVLLKRQGSQLLKLLPFLFGINPNVNTISTRVYFLTSELYFSCMTRGILTTVFLCTAVTTLVKDLSGSDCGNEGRETPSSRFHMVFVSLTSFL